MARNPSAGETRCKHGAAWLPSATSGGLGTWECAICAAELDALRAEGQRQLSATIEQRDRESNGRGESGITVRLSSGSATTRAARAAPSYVGTRDALLGFFVDDALANLRAWLGANAEHPRAAVVSAQRDLIVRLDRYYVPMHLADKEHAALRGAVERLKPMLHKGAAWADRMLEAEQPATWNWFPLLGRADVDDRKRRLVLGCIEYTLREAGFRPADIVKLIPDLESREAGKPRTESPHAAQATRMRKRIERWLAWRAEEPVKPL